MTVALSRCDEIVHGASAGDVPVTDQPSTTGHASSTTVARVPEHGAPPSPHPYYGDDGMRR